MNALAWQWRCLDPDCAEHGTGPDSYTAAVAHGRATGHGTATSGRAG